MDVAGDLLVTKSADGANTVSAMSIKSSSYMPPLHYMQLPPRYLWSQGIYPRDLHLQPREEVEEIFHLVAPE